MRLRSNWYCTAHVIGGRYKPRFGSSRTISSLVGAVVHDDRQRPARAHEELVALAMRVFAPHVHPGDVEDHEVALRHERNVPRELARGQGASKVAGDDQPVERDPPHGECRDG